MQNIQEFYPQYSQTIINKLTELQQLIWQVAEEQGTTLSESAKWGQLSFAAKKGTPIRIDQFSDKQIALLVHCQTTLIENWKALFPQQLTFSRNRAVVLSVDSPLPAAELAVCIAMALNYHASNKGR